MGTTLPLSGRGWTYGVEHELADWDTRRGWDGYGRDPEPNIVNSNGIAADPSLKFWPYGAEVNTPPTEKAADQAQLFYDFLAKHPDTTTNWRCGMHVHIRVPGLSKSLPWLKRLARYINENTRVYDLVDPLPLASAEEHGAAYRQARRRYNWMRMSHFTKIPDYRVRAQQKATTLMGFFEAEVPRSKKGRPLWHAQPRAAINLRQLLQTDTIEFRHFPQPMAPDEVTTAVEWCRDYLLAAFDSYPAVALYQASYQGRRFPLLETIYVHWQEERWLLTTPTRNPRPVVESNVRRFLDEDRQKGDRREWVLERPVGRRLRSVGLSGRTAATGRREGEGEGSGGR